MHQSSANRSLFSSFSQYRALPSGLRRLLYAALTLVVFSGICQFLLIIQIQTQNQTTSNGAITDTRYVYQAQRELLRLSALASRDIATGDKEAFELQIDLTASRIALLDQRSQQEQASGALKEQISVLRVGWSNVRDNLTRLQVDPNNAEWRDAAFSSMRRLEVDLNDLAGASERLSSGQSTDQSALIGRTLWITSAISVIFLLIAGLIAMLISRFMLKLSEASEALHMSEVRYELAVSASSVKIWDTQLPNTIAQPYLNSEATSLREDAFDNEKSLDPFWHSIYPADRPRVAQNLQRLIDANGGQFDEEYRLIQPDESLKIIVASGTIFLDPNTNSLHILGTTTDVTDIKKSEEAVRQAQRLESVGILAGGIAHDFNNLLTGIIGQNSVALKRLAPEHPARKHIEKADRSAERAADLTKQLLAYAGRGQMSLVDFDLNDWLRESKDILSLSISNKVNLDFELEPQILPIQADKAQLQQVLMNLIINAADAIESKTGLIEITTARVTLTAPLEKHVVEQVPALGDYVKVRVRDNGSGIQPDTLAKIFDPFFTTKTTGRGFGLSTTHGVVRACSGGLTVDSRVGVGTTFDVYLPLSAESISDSLPIDTMSVFLDTEGSVLIVDDEEPIRDLLAAILDDAGVPYIMANNGQEGLEKLVEAREQIAAIILDVQMPVMNGWEALSRMRRLYPNARIILSTGYGPRELDRPELHEQPSAFLPKPYKANDVLTTLSQVMHSRITA